MTLLLVYLVFLVPARISAAVKFSDNSEYLWKQLRPEGASSLSSGRHVAVSGSRTAENAAYLLQPSVSNARRKRRCVFNCARAPLRAVCGSDGNTYPSTCFVNYLRRCYREKLRILQLRACPSASSRLGNGKLRGSCPSERQEIVKKLSAGENVAFVPSCRRDGSFRNVQCNHRVRYCFCVNRQSGRPMTGTGVLLPRRPRCKNKRKKRRKKGRRGGGVRRRTRCKKKMRKQFTANLIRQFVVEFRRATAQHLNHRNSGRNTMTAVARGGIAGNVFLQHRRFVDKRAAAVGGPFATLPLQGAEGFPLNTTERRAAEWKFSELDRNQNNRLSVRETRVLRRMARKFIRPAACSRRMFRHCDYNRNRQLERLEWRACLGLGKKPAKRNRNSGFPTRSPTGYKKPEESSILTLISKPRRNRSGPFPKQKCIDMRRDALEKNRMQTSGKVFVPLCMADGRYAKLQCHVVPAAEKLCFCMDPDSGRVVKGIRGRSNSSDVNCENIKPIRIFKGCPLFKQKRFLANLIDLVVMETKSKWGSQNGPRMSGTVTLEERALRWKFHILDRDQNNVLDKREVKKWRRQMKNDWRADIAPDLRKCARNFLKFCDDNDDKKLTMVELRTCTKINGASRHYRLKSSRPLSVLSLV